MFEDKYLNKYKKYKSKYTKAKNASIDNNVSSANNVRADGTDRDGGYINKDAKRQDMSDPAYDNDPRGRASANYANNKSSSFVDGNKWGQYKKMSATDKWDDDIGDDWNYNSVDELANKRSTGGNEWDSYGGNRAYQNNVERENLETATYSLYPVIDEIFFWSRQMKEHMLFLHLGLENTNNNNTFKAACYEMYKKWDKFISNVFPAKKINADTLTLSLESLNKLGDKIPHREVNKLIEATIKLKSEIVQVLKEGKWIGWIYPSLIEHMIEEAIYFSRKINGPRYSLDEEMKYISHHHDGELSVTAQLIDPCPEQQKIIAIVRSYVNKRMSTIGDKADGFPKNWSKHEEAMLLGLNPTEETNLLMLSIRFGKELVEFSGATGDKIDSKELKSIISPILAQHVHREFERFTDTLERLQEMKVAEAPIYN